MVRGNKDFSNSTKYFETFNGLQENTVRGSQFWNTNTKGTVGSPALFSTHNLTIAEWPPSFKMEKGSMLWREKRWCGEMEIPVPQTDPYEVKDSPDQTPPCKHWPSY